MTWPLDGIKLEPCSCELCVRRSVIVAELRIGEERHNTPGRFGGIVPLSVLPISPFCTL